ncbi:MAG: TonB-dependent receptor [Betaproteobacteria bacterium]|nr:TonB-dependent receptor [Betaproteobacteria bacterium]
MRTDGSVAGRGAPVLMAGALFNPRGISLFHHKFRFAGTQDRMEIAMPKRKHPLVALCLPAVIFFLSPLPSLAQDSPVSEAHELVPVVVTATRQEMRVSEALADVTVIDREEIERAGQETVIELLSRQPGVQTIQQGGSGTASSIYLRGANYNQTKVLIDGIEINSLDGSGSILRFVPLADVERIEILRGPASSLYGANTIGGVIQIITRRAQSGFRGDAFVGYGSHNTGRINASVSGGNEKWRFRAEGNHFETDGISARRDGINKDADKDFFRNTGGAAALSFLPAKGHEFGISYRNNRGVAHYDGGPQDWSKLTPSDGDYDYRERFDIGQWRIFARNRIMDSWESELSYAEAEDKRDDYNTWNVPTGGVTRTRTKNRQWTWQNNVDLPLGRALLAVEHLKQTTGPRTDPTAWEPVLYDRDPKFHNTSALAGWTANYGYHLWQLNIRRDRHSEFGGKTTFGMSYGHLLTETLRAHIGYGTAFRAPTIVDLYRPGWGGNPELKPEEAKNAEAGLTWEQGAHLISATYYHNRVKDLIIWQPAPYPYGRNENVGKALLEGVTLNWQSTFGAWRMNVGYDWLNAQNRSKDPVDGTGYERLGRRARDKATFGVNYVQGNLNAGIEQIIVGRRYDGNYKKNAADKEELGGFGLTNLTVGYALTPELRLEARLNNLFDKKYEMARYYSTHGFNAFIGLRYSPR